MEEKYPRKRWGKSEKIKKRVRQDKPQKGRKAKIQVDRQKFWQTSRKTSRQKGR